jgi:hypothetical protein
MKLYRVRSISRYLCILKKHFHFFFYGSILLVSLSCDKSNEGIGEANPPTGQYLNYTIHAGNQYCDQNGYTKTDYSELKFLVQFDSSAIYHTVAAENQYDVNKLYGFSDNNAAHHDFSARVGWRWSDGALRLFGYIYNNGVMSFEELGTISIGTEYTCSIKVESSNYIFALNGKTLTMPRASTTATAVGYKLYPYFGGDESAPHTITIRIKEL